jgi:peptide/nickel transport system substrate-binding protein
MPTYRLGWSIRNTTDRPGIAAVGMGGIGGLAIRVKRVGERCLRILERSQRAYRDAKPGAPNLFKGYDVNEDFTVWTFYLREGIRWSDGYPLTAEDYYLYWRYDRANPDINAGINVDDITIEENAIIFYNEDGRRRTVKREVIDDYTIRYTSDKPYPTLLNSFSHASGWWDYYIQPMHFLKQFHPDFIGEEAAVAKAEKAGFDTWYQLYEYFTNRQGQQTTAQVLGNFPPTLNSYVLVSKTQTTMVFERNPYYWKVDTEGYQLPYIDRIVVEHVPDRQIIVGKIISGEVDFEGFMTETPDIPLYRKYEQIGDYRTEIWNFAANATGLQLNTNYNDEVVRDLFCNRDFRVALQLSVDRKRINDEIMFGLARPVNMSVLPGTMWYKLEYEEAYAEFDPEQAKQILDSIGVVDVNGDGWREDPQGRAIAFDIEYIVSEAPRAQILEIVEQNFRDIGINATSQQREATFGFQRASTNDMAIWVWHGDARTEMLFPAYINSHIFPTSPGIGWWQWFTSEGRVGSEPPEDVKELFTWFNNLQYSTTREEMIYWGQKMLDNAAKNIWRITTVCDFPHPMIVNNDIANYPTKDDGPLIYEWSTWWTNAYEPSQFFFKTRPQLKYEDSLLPTTYSPTETSKDPLDRAMEKGWL